MRITLEPTDKFVELIDPMTNGHQSARVWEGQTEDGVPVVAFVARVAVRLEEDRSRFERELMACPPMRSTEAWPARMVL